MAFGFCIKDRDKKHYICKSYIVPYFYRVVSTTARVRWAMLWWGGWERGR